ncbi:metal-sensitive transcriptional regulator [Brachybacterium sp. EF45031]|nr:metal-sensitive transcriptional regulator [Brachybacterium sillae]MCS6712174.1 metal-sensitive transcriptional regulator [Brachybacterium sillae]
MPSTLDSAAASPSPDAPGVSPATHSTPGSPDASTPAPGYHDAKAAYLRRLKLVEGQVRGLQRMIEDDVYCIDVLTQVSAVTKALQSVATALVDDHIHHCVHQAAHSGDPAELDAKMDEVMTAVKRLMR